MYSDSQSLNSLVESDDDKVPSAAQWPCFREENDMKNPVPKLGMQFENPNQFRMFTRHYVVLRGVDLKWPKK